MERGLITQKKDLEQEIKDFRSEIETRQADFTLKMNEDMIMHKEILANEETLSKQKIDDYFAEKRVEFNQELELANKKLVKEKANLETDRESLHRFSEAALQETVMLNRANRSPSVNVASNKDESVSRLDKTFF